jgi:predicted nucleic acid-binding protein
MAAAGSTFLWDANVLIARAMATHEHYAVVVDWTTQHPLFATTPITQGSLVRYLVRTGNRALKAAEVLARVTQRNGHKFWPDDVGYDGPMLARVHGHGDVTDAYLAQLARHHGGKLATLDRRLGDLHPDVTVVIPT